MLVVLLIVAHFILSCPWIVWGGLARLMTLLKVLGELRGNYTYQGSAGALVYIQGVASTIVLENVKTHIYIYTQHQHQH